MTEPFVTHLDLKLADKLLGDLKLQGFEITNPQYTIFQATKKGVSCTLYASGKLMVQGKDMKEFIEFYLEPEILMSFDFTYQDNKIDPTPRIGIDEAGKGDFFGPLCVAGVFAEGDGVAELKKLGVRDSKNISDAKIITIGNQIKKKYEHHIVKINPAKYNELYEQFHNLNKLLAWGHATTIENLVARTKCREVIVDQFAAEWVVLTALKRKKMEIDLKQRHRAEEDLVVAAASILARQTFLEGIEALGKEWGVPFPKGASNQVVEAAKLFVQKYGPEVLPKVCKRHFKTYGVVLGE